MCVCVCVSVPHLHLHFSSDFLLPATHRPGHTTVHRTTPFHIMSIYQVRCLSFKSHTGTSKRARDNDWIGGVSVKGPTDGHVADRRNKHTVQCNRWYAALRRVDLMQPTSPFPLISSSSFLFPHTSPLPSIPFFSSPLIRSAHHAAYRVLSGYWDWANKTNLRIVRIYHN